MSSSSSSTESRYRPTPSATTATTENTTATVLVKLFSSAPKSAASLLTDIRPLFRLNDNISNILEWKDPPSSALLLISFLSAVSFLNPNTIISVHSALLALLAIFTWGWFTAKKEQVVNDMMLLIPHSARLPIPPNSPSLPEPFAFPTSADVASLTTNMEQLASLFRRIHRTADEIRDLIFWKRSTATLRVIKILLFIVYPFSFLIFRLLSARQIILIAGSLGLVWYSPWITLLRQLMIESTAFRRVTLIAETATDNAACFFTEGPRRLRNAFTARKSVKRTGQRKRKGVDKDGVVRSFMKEVKRKDQVNANGEGGVGRGGEEKKGEEQVKESGTEGKRDNERESERKEKVKDEDEEELEDEEEGPVHCTCACHCQWPRGTSQGKQRCGLRAAVLLTPKEFKVFENQRWWVGLEWAPIMLPAERPCWSDENGEPSFNPTEFKFPPIPSHIASSIETTCTSPTSSSPSPSTPTSTHSTSYARSEIQITPEKKYYWKWIDPSWRITAPPSSSVFTSTYRTADLRPDDIPQLPQTPSPSPSEDPEGWEYTDSLWLFPTPTLNDRSLFGFGKSLRSKLKVTRRRRWSRVAGVYTNCECKCE